MKRVTAILLASTAACLLNMSIAQAASEQVLYSFCSQSGCADGQEPTGPLLNINGTLYGATYYGGSNDVGTLFSFDPQNNTETVLNSFGAASDGNEPNSGVIAAGSTLYGTTKVGGSDGLGTVFKFTLGKNHDSVLHSFSGPPDGEDAYNSVIDSGQVLYGTTTYGGSKSCGQYSCGVLFSVNRKTGAESVLYNFGRKNDGYWPYGGLVSSNGILYGTTTSGGKYGAGTIFSFNPANQIETVLYSFSGDADGSIPNAGVIVSSGFLYGTTYYGGQNSCACGTVFSYNLSTGAESVLYTFIDGADGALPAAGIIKIGKLLYGTAYNGGSAGLGTVFSVNSKTGAEVTLHSFAGGADGAYPVEGLINVSGTLYGVTHFGGPNDGGVLFSVTP